MGKYNNDILIKFIEFETSYANTDFKLIKILNIEHSNDDLNVYFRCKIKNTNDLDIDSWDAIMPIKLHKYETYQEKELNKLRRNKIKKLMI